MIFPVERLERSVVLEKCHPNKGRDILTDDMLEKKKEKATSLLRTEYVTMVNDNLLVRVLDSTKPQCQGPHPCS